MADRAVVIGAGMVGLLSAYFLRRRGLEVTVLDEGEVGMACSYGNAGFICPSLSAPLPAPGLVGRSVRWMLRRDSPLYIKPSALPRTLSWLLSFWRHCNAQDHEAGLDAMLSLNRRTLALYDALREDGVEFEMHEDGLLFVFLSAQDLEEELRELRKVERGGLPAPRAVSKEEALSLEPSLSNRVAGGVLLPAERHVEPQSLSRGVAAWLRQAGVELRTGAKVESFERSGERVISLRAGGERVAGDHFVLAAGAHTGGLGAQLGVPLPIQAGKGYSITYRAPNLSFRHALYFGDTKAVLSQYEGGVRIAGTMEFSGLNLRLDPARLDGLRAAVRPYLREELRGESAEEWTGMRPVTPDGLPAIGRLGPLRNVFVSTGHAANGVYMAPASGELLAELIVDQKASVDPAPFDPGRFASR